MREEDGGRALCSLGTRTEVYRAEEERLLCRDWQEADGLPPLPCVGEFTCTARPITQKKFPHTHTRAHTWGGGGGGGKGVVSKGKRTAHGRDKAVGRHSGTDTELQMACISGKCREGGREAVVRCRPTEEGGLPATRCFFNGGYWG